jgi:hypothetical protein
MPAETLEKPPRRRLSPVNFGGTAPFLLTWLSWQGRADWYFGSPTIRAECNL